MCVRKQRLWFLGLLSDYAADMVIWSSEGCDESGGVDSLVVGVSGGRSAGSPSESVHI